MKNKKATQPPRKTNFLVDEEPSGKPEKPHPILKVPGMRNPVWSKYLGRWFIPSPVDRRLGSELSGD